MFCDLVGSTALSARLDPEEMSDVLGAFQKACVTTVTWFGGSVAKYMGDGALVYFGYPEAHEDDAERAVRAGLALIDAMAAMPLSVPLRPQVRVGIATGLVVVGELIGEGSAQERVAVGAIKQFGASANQVVIMPFMTNNRQNGGILPADWQGILTDLLTDVRQVMNGSGSGPVSISEVVVSSFSAGFLYSENFRANAVGLQPLLRQVWDFDGFPKNDSSKLVSTASVTAVKYDQGTEPGCFHVPLSRWGDYPDPPPNPADPPKPAGWNDVHRGIRNFMFLDAATRR